MRFIALIAMVVFLSAACGDSTADSSAAPAESATVTTSTTTTTTAPTTTTVPTTTTTTTSTTTTTAPPETTTTTLPGGLDVTFATEIVFEQSENSVWKSAVFTAEGPAVDEGLVCAGGTVDLQGFDTSIGSWRHEIIYLCDDGSGQFNMELELKVSYTDAGYTESGPWTIVWGSGEYENLVGSGTDVTNLPEPNFYVGEQIGQIAQG